MTQDDPLVEYICKKCGNTFVDLASYPTHDREVDNNGVDRGECGGEGEPQYEFSNPVGGEDS